MIATRIEINAVFVGCWLASVQICASATGKGCVLNIPGDNEPLLLSRGHLTPARAQTLLRPRDKLVVSCPGRGNSVQGHREVETECRENGSLSLAGSLGCSKAVSGEVKRRGGKCGAGSRGTQLQIGFTVDGKWFPTIQVCHDNSTSATYYTQHRLLNPGNQTCTDAARPGFQTGDFYLGMSPDRLYKQSAFQSTLAGLLGSEDQAKRYTTLSYLARGHLAPDGDFLDEIYQRLTYFYVNTAPQWQSVNAGNWLSVEKTVRNFGRKASRDLDVVTGTLGVLQLRHARGGAPTDVYLLAEGTRRAIPVPKYFWKVVSDPSTDSAIVFVVLNDPYADVVQPADFPCKDECGNWLKGSQYKTWRKVRRGFTFCCNVADFRAVVGYLPRLNATNTLRRLRRNS